MSSDARGSFQFRGTSRIFVSTMKGLFGHDESIVLDDAFSPYLVVRPHRETMHYEFIRFEPFEFPNRSTLVLWNSPQKANLSALAGEMIDKLRELGFVLELSASSAAKAGGVVPMGGFPGAGRPGLKAHARARERLDGGENEDAVRADWRKDYKDEIGTAPADTTSGEKQLWRNVKRGKK